MKARALTEDEAVILSHMLNARSWGGQRNYFVCGPCGPELAALEVLRAAGMVQRQRYLYGETSKSWIYRATKAGREALAARVGVPRPAGLFELEARSPVTGERLRVYSVAERLVQVRACHDRLRLRAAMLTPHLQKTVRRAIEGRLRALEKRPLRGP